MKVTKVQTAEQLLNANCLIKHYAGSRAYGTALPTSDTDFRGVFVADPLNIRTPFYPIREVDDKSEEDTKFYELFQFMKLSLACNPNVVETLWVDQSSIVYQTDGYRILREARSEFLSSRIAMTTCGYALSQLKRIKGHNKWINKPHPVDPPAQKDFVTLVHNFTETKNTTFKFSLDNFNRDHRLVPYGNDIFGLYRVEGGKTLTIENHLITDYQGDSDKLGYPLVIVKFNKGEYKLAHEQWSNYWTWKNNRNKARSELEEAHGFDTKHAMHLIRLLRMGKEALETGVINVLREDADYLLEIRAGVYDYQTIVTEAEQLERYIFDVALPNTKLPKQPNLLKAANICMEVQDAMWGK